MIKYLIFLVVALMAFGACGDSADCTAETVKGIYEGQSVCSDGTLDGSSSFAVNGSGDNITFADEFGDEYSVSLNGCSFDIPELTIEFFGIEITTSGEGEFNGETLTMTIYTEAVGMSTDCVFTGTRQ